MKEIDVESYNVPAEARSKNYRGSLATVVGGGGAAIIPSSVVSGGVADTAKVAQSLAADSPDWAKIMRKDQDERTDFSLSIGKDLIIGDIKVSYDSANGALALTRVSDSTLLASLYATGGLTAYGAGSGTSGGGTSYNRLDKWSEYTTDKATYILSALLGDDLNTRVSKLESSTLTSVDWSIIANKPSVFAPALHTHAWADITDHPTKLSAFTNDTAFITASAIPTKLSAFTNDAGFVTSIGWSDITNKPSTFTPSAHTHVWADITDAPTKLSQFTNDIHAATLNSLVIGDIKVSYDSTNGALALTRVSDSTKLASLYTTGGLTAYGAGSGTPSAGTSYNRLDKWSEYTTDKATYVLSAFLGNDLNTRITKLENSTITSVDWSIIANKPSVFAPSAHMHVWADITDHPTKLSGYGITDANISGGIITLGTNSITPLTQHQDISGKSDIKHTHTVKINGTTKTIAATGGTAVDLGTYLTSHQSLSAYPTATQMTAAINNAVGALDVASVGGSGKYLQAISETDGKISASVATLPTKLSQFANDSGFITSSAIPIKLSQFTDNILNGHYLSLSGGTMTGNLSTSANGGAWVHAMQSNAIMYNNLGTGTGDNSWEAFLGIKTNSGNIVSYGSIYDQVGFALYLHGRTDNNKDGYTYLDTTTGIWHFDKTISGNAATSTVASKLGRNGNSGVPMTFNWSGQSGQPSWLWGGGDGTNMYVYNPSNFNVNSAVKLATVRSLWGQSFNGTGNIDGLLKIQANSGSWTEGIRIKPYSSWTTILLGGNDLSADTGTSPNTWSIHNNNGSFYVNKNSSNGHTGYELCNVSGNWGIGTNSPSYKLDVAGKGRFQGDLVIGNTTIHASGSNGGINSIQPADDYIIGDCNIGGTMGLKSLNTASAGISFYGNNNSHYGTLTASSNGLTWTGNILATGGVTAYTSSDRRLKKNIRPLDSLSVIRSLGGTYQFDYKKDNKHSIGFIAQNVRKSELSDMVRESDGYLKINYLDTRLISLALGASVELDDEVTRLKKRVGELEKEVERLKAA